LWASEGEGATIVVAKDGGGDYSRIQDAIDNATEGDTIRVWEGTYEENVVVNKTVSLVGNGSKLSIVDGRGAGYVITVLADSVYIQGFKITNEVSPARSGIRLESNNNTIMDNNISNNVHGIFAIRSQNNIIINNFCSNNENEGIVLYYHSDNNLLDNNSCMDNQKGIYLWHYSINNSITNNTCSNNGDGIFIEESNNNTISGNLLIGNERTNLMLHESHSNTVINNKGSQSTGIIGICIWINISDRNFLSNNVCMNNIWGIDINHGQGNIITQNYLLNNVYAGIHSRGSNNNIIEYNTCS